MYKSARCVSEETDPISRFNLACIRFSISGAKFDLASIRFNSSGIKTLWKTHTIDWSITNWCILGQWRLCGQCGGDVSWQACSDPTQICTSAGADEALLERGGRAGKPRGTNFERLLIPLVMLHPGTVAYLHKSRRHHPRPDWSQVRTEQGSEKWRWNKKPLLIMLAYHFLACRHRKSTEEGWVGGGFELDQHVISFSSVPPLITHPFLFSR